jgi:hypothetical protein
MHKLIFAALLACASCADPVTLDDVAGRPREERLTTLGRATEAERAAIYQEHLARVAAGPGATAAERAGLARLGELAANGDEREADQLLRGMREETIRAVLALGGEGP